MGRGIAQLFAESGCIVRLFDSLEGAAAKGIHKAPKMDSMYRSEFRAGRETLLPGVVPSSRKPQASRDTRLKRSSKVRLRDPKVVAIECGLCRQAR